MTEDEEMEKLQARYARAMHAIQSGVAIQMTLVEQGSVEGETAPKHLRVGVNSALLNDSALAGLLIAKGVITKLEYVEAVTVEAEKEQAEYEKKLQEQMGCAIKLG